MAKASNLISPYVTFRYKLDDDPMPSVDVNYRYSVEGDLSIFYSRFRPIFTRIW